MFSEEVKYLAEVSVKKLKFLKSGRTKYLTSAAMAGMYVGLGILLIYTIGGYLDAANSPFTKTLMGASFGIALSLVMMAGAELFTGNNMIMTIGMLEKKVTALDTLNVWFYGYVGNLIGAVVLSLIYWQTGLASGHTGEFIVHIAEGKMATPFNELFFRGILCNILVCLSTWCAYKLKSESGKIIMICMCLFAFITSGYEHSIANMTLLTVALLIPHSAGVTVGGWIHNLTAVTLGNIVGGALFMGVTYWYVAKTKNK